MFPRFHLRAVELTILLALAFAGAAMAESLDMDAGALDARPLQLEVTINGAPTNLIGSFLQLANGKFAARRSELIGLGLKVPGTAIGDDLIIIDDLAGLKYHYDESTQKIALDLSESMRAPRIYDARGSPMLAIASRSDYGAVLNYDLFAGSAWRDRRLSFGGANAALDGRIFGPFGVLDQSAMLNLPATGRVEAIRLDTTWAYADPDELVTYRAGDIITGGLRWTRPVRLGGVQVQRSFGLRPDLITFPLPSVSGSATVPSSIDLYVNGVLTRTQDVPSGPFQFDNVPVSSGHGDVVVVVRDAAGRRTEAQLSFYGTPQLLREGLSSFSAELGLPRQFFGSNKSGYVDRPAASATFVHGLRDWFTIEAHAEAGQNLLNAGLGSVTRLGNWGVASVAASASRFQEETGFQTNLAYDLQLAAFNIRASSLRTWDTYSDLGVATAVGPGFKQAKALDAISFGLPVGSDARQLGATFLHQESADGEHRSSVSVSYHQPLFENATGYFSAFKGIDDDEYGLFAGVTMAIGAGAENDFTLSTGVETTNEGTTATLDAGRASGTEPGSFGWQVHLAEGHNTFRRAAANYRGDLFDAGAAIQQFQGNVDLTMQAAGAVALLGFDPFLTRRVDDAFAVVDAGAPGVRVMRENRAAGVTDSRGLLLVPDVQSYNRNKLSIDVTDLPLNANAVSAAQIVAPNERSGLRVSFGVEVSSNAALVILTDRQGAVIPAGTTGRVEETGEPFVVGHDGQTYLTQLGPSNTVAINAAAACRATFAFTPDPLRQVVVGPVVCQ